MRCMSRWAAAPGGLALLIACSAAPYREPSDEEALDVGDPSLALPELLLANEARVDALVDRAREAAAWGAALDVEARAACGPHTPAEIDAEFRSRRRAALSPEEKAGVERWARAAGLDAAQIELDGQLLLVEGDAQLALRTGSLPSAELVPANKAKVLAQVVSEHASIAPVMYARVAGNEWLFQLPDLEQNVMLVADDVPDFVFEGLVVAVAMVAFATSEDCLDPGFMTVMRQATYEAMPEGGRATLRTKAVVYEPDACPGDFAACAQYPTLQSVVLAPPQSGRWPALEPRFVTGRRIGIDSDEVRSSSESCRATLAHELMHTLGIAHPKVELLGNDRVASKWVVPGTVAGSCAAAPCAPGTHYPSIMHQSGDFGRSMSLAPDDIDALATLYARSSGCGYSSRPRLVEAR